MRKRIKEVKLSRKKGARQALAKSLAKALILSGRIKTTKTRAKFAQKYVENLVTLAKKNSLAANRRIFALLPDKQITKKLVAEIAPKFANISSGFTRVVNLEVRRGDAAPIALLEFVYQQDTEAEKKKEVKEGVSKDKKDEKSSK